MTIYKRSVVKYYSLSCQSSVFWLFQLSKLKTILYQNKPIKENCNGNNQYWTKYKDNYNLYNQIPYKIIPGGEPRLLSENPDIAHCTGYGLQGQGISPLPNGTQYCIVL